MLPCGLQHSCVGLLCDNIDPLFISGLASVCHLINEGVVHEVRSPDAQVENVYLFQDGVVESVQKP